MKSNDLRKIPTHSSTAVLFSLMLIFLAYGFARLFIAHDAKRSLWIFVVVAALAGALLLAPMYAKFAKNRDKEAAKAEKYNLFG